MNFVQKFNDRFQKALEQKPFEANLSMRWLATARKALFFTSLMALGINPEDWWNLLQALNTGKMNLYQFALLSNNLQARTPNDLSLSLEQYQELMQEADAYVKEWNAQTESLRKEIEAVLLEEQKLEQEQIAKNVDAAKNGGFQPVIGKA